MIYVISLRSEAVRRAAVKDRMDSLGLNFELIDAFDARENKHLSNLIDQKKINKNIHRKLTSVEIACAVSHRSVYEKILEHNLPGAFVFEDDVIIDEKFIAVHKWFSENEEKFRNSTTVMHLGVSSIESIKSLVLNPVGGTKGDGFYLFNLIQRLSEEAWGAYSYYISNDLAALILKENKIITAADHWSVLVGKNKGCIRILSPSCCSHPDTFDLSSLEKSRSFAKYEYFKCIYRDPVHILKWVYRKTILKYTIRPFVKKFIIRNNW